MNNNKENAKEKIARLVEQFAEHIDEYKRGNYNEHQTRVDYINPFFKALGWDMDNHQGLAEAYREVIHEDKIKIGGSTKAPDYCFTVYGQRKFFVDAKKPSVNIKGDISPAYQVRRYGWSAKLPISIVTDFEEFSIYDCSRKPNQTDKASVSRIKYITYDNYLEEFDFFWDTFAQENILKGRFDKFVKSDTKKRGTAAVDDEFLQSIEEWRKYLATTIALRNLSLSEEEINFAVQKNIDRIIFLRICEDRGIERYGDLKNVIKNGNFYQNLFGLYRIADDKYNSGLFDFKNDNITPALTVDNKVVKNIISEIYYPLSPYEFSVFPADILGSVYERFLGKTIRLTKAHYAKIEEKPEVRKAGGVYYTPKYIVDYIVENTIGKLIKDKNPKDVEKIKIVDPACGSGSFLIGAYQYLLDWHLQYYTGNTPPKKGENPLTPDGNLTTAEKKRILLNNIYGVDIDAQAVEVTKLNLLLKALEGETNASVSKQLTFFNERVLPNLGDNIKCGNSLIGNDFYDNQLELFPEQIKKINAFDWDKAFPEIFKDGGFDVVIGNPPWGAFYQENEKEYLKNKYTASDSENESYIHFVENSYSILKASGCFGYIIPSNILTNIRFVKIRNFLLNRTSLKFIIDLGSNVFNNVAADSCILIYKKEKSVQLINTKYFDNDKENEKLKQVDYKNIKQLIFYDTPYNIFNIYVTQEQFQINKKIDLKKHKQLIEFVNISRGIEFGYSSNYIKHIKENDNYKPIIAGRCFGKYYINFGNKYVKHIKENISIYKNKEIFEKPKVFIKRIGTTIVATYDDNKFYNVCDVYNVLLKDKSNINIKYLLAILNSKLLSFYYSVKYTNAKKLFPKIPIKNLYQLPIKYLDLSNKKEKQTHDTIVTLVDNLLNLNKELQSTKLETHRQQLQRAIDHAENKIDELVYELYGLTEEEIGIVENL